MTYTVTCTVTCTLPLKSPYKSLQVLAVPSCTMYPTYPDATALRNFLLTNELVNEEYIGDFDGPITASIRNWETRTGYTPFLSDGLDKTLRFNPPGPEHSPRHSYNGLGGYSIRGGGRRLDLDGGIIREPTVLTVDGREMVRDDDYELLPENSDVKGQPFTIVRFTRPVFCRPRGIAVTAPWGYATTLPSNAHQAIVQGAAAIFFYAIPNLSDLETATRDGLSESFEIASTVTANQRGEALQKIFDEGVESYRRAW